MRPSPEGLWPILKLAENPHGGSRLVILDDGATAGWRRSAGRIASHLDSLTPRQFSHPGQLQGVNCVDGQAPTSGRRVLGH